LNAFGLCALGACPDGEEHIVLIGPDEPHFWHIFKESAEYRDGQPDPLDRWSERVITEVADVVGGSPLFPFGGPPYQPFYTWAVDTGRAWPSPIGFLVHDSAGLFVSFRGAIRLRATIAPAQSTQPCKSCQQPCRTACPVGAFNDGYDVAACKAHVASEAGADCLARGCRARRACPVGQGLRLPAQARFHMEAFL